MDKEKAYDVTRKRINAHLKAGVHDADEITKEVFFLIWDSAQKEYSKELNEIYEAAQKLI